MTRAREGARGAEPAPGWLLWAAFAATPAIWFAYFMAAYVFNEATCSAMERAFGGLGVPMGSVLFLATVAATALVVAATVAAWRVGRRARRTADAYDDFLPHAGFVMGLLVTFVMLAHLLQIVMVGACA